MKSSINSEKRIKQYQHWRFSPPIDPAVCVSVLRLRCKVGQVCEEVARVPLINMAWEQALAIWGQHSMSADEHRRRMLTHTLHSSTVRATTAAHKLLKQQVHSHTHSDLWMFRQAVLWDVLPAHILLVPLLLLSHIRPNCWQVLTTVKE